MDKMDLFAHKVLNNTGVAKYVQDYCNDDWELFGEIKNFTCNDCSQVMECKFAFDLYNTNDDCIAEK